MPCFTEYPENCRYPGIEAEFLATIFKLFNISIKFVYDELWEELVLNSTYDVTAYTTIKTTERYKRKSLIQIHRLILKGFEKSAKNQSTWVYKNNINLITEAQMIYYPEPDPWVFLSKYEPSVNRLQSLRLMSVELWSALIGLTGLFSMFNVEKIAVANTLHQLSIGLNHFMHGSTNSILSW